VERRALEPPAPLLLQAPPLAEILRADAPLVEQELLEGAVAKFHGRQERIPVDPLTGKRAGRSRRPPAPVVEHARQGVEERDAGLPARVARRAPMVPNQTPDVPRPAPGGIAPGAQRHPRQ